MKPTIQKAIIIIFFAIIFLLSGCLVLNHDKVLSQSENRILAQFPELSMNTIMSGEFMKGFETFVNDQITGRDWFVQLSTKVKLATGQKDINGVYIHGENLYSKTDNLSEDQYIKIEKSTTQLAKFLANNPNAYFGIIPTAIAISDIEYPNKLNQQELIDSIYANLPESQTLNLYDNLLAHKTESIYYHTDHHWTTLGAYYGYKTIGEALGFVIPDKSSYTVEVLKDDFSGTTQAKLNIPIAVDTIEQWSLDKNTIYYRLINDSVESDSLYDMDKLSSSEPYAVFLGGNNGKVVVKNNSISEDKQGTKLLIVKDSYSHCLTPFLLEQYEEVTLLDLRYAGVVAVQTLIDKEQYDNILVIYNTDNFITETKLPLLNK